MIDPITLYDLLARKPFQPVRLHLADARALDVVDRQMVVVGVDYVNVGVQAEDEPAGICDHVITVPLTEVQRVEDIQVLHA